MDYTAHNEATYWREKKSFWISFVLALFFGPLGLCYCDKVLSCLLTVISIISMSAVVFADMSLESNLCAILLVGIIYLISLPISIVLTFHYNNCLKEFLDLYTYEE